MATKYNVEVTTVGDYQQAGYSDTVTVESLQQLFEETKKYAGKKFQAIILSKDGQNVVSEAILDDNDAISLLTYSGIWEEYAKKLTVQALDELLGCIYTNANKSVLSKSAYSVEYKG